MKTPEYPWPDTGRSYPDDAQLVVVNLHPKWADLCWKDTRRDVDVYLSTLPYETFQKLPNKVG